MTRAQVGTFQWVDLETTNVDVAKAYYALLFGWTYEERRPGGREGSRAPCWVAQLRGRPVAGLTGVARGRGDHTTRSATWHSYIHVRDIDAAAAQIPKLGGRIIAKPFDVEGWGRRAIATDTGGAEFRLWQSTRVDGVAALKRTSEPGTLGWNQLSVRDVTGAASFYTKLMGWTARSIESGPTPMAVFCHRGVPTASVLGVSSKDEQTAQRWTPYFSTYSCTAMLRRVGGPAGAQQTEFIKGVGRYAPVQDPEGAEFALLEME